MVSLEVMGYFEDIQKFVRLIPRGKAATYGSVARAAGHPGTARQVAWALRDATALGLPWQRVLGSGGQILLKGEPGLLQRMLLELEGVPFKGSHIDLRKCEFHFPSVRACSRVRRPQRRTKRRRR